MASRLTLARPAVRKALKGRIMIAGATGAGKTFTALEMMTAMVPPGGRILGIDTERYEMLTYADRFTFDHLPWEAPFDPRELAQAILEAGAQYDGIIIDSATHFWNGTGGVLDIAGNQFAGWKVARPAQEDLVKAFKRTDAHVILGVRSKMDHVQEQDARGKTVIRKLGLAPVQDGDLEYEVNLALALDMNHTVTVTKSRTTALPPMRSWAVGTATDLGRTYLEWLDGGVPPISQEELERIKGALGALTEAGRAWGRVEWTARGIPALLALTDGDVPRVEELLTEARLIADPVERAEALVADQLGAIPA